MTSPLRSFLLMAVLLGAGLPSALAEGTIEKFRESFEKRMNAELDANGDSARVLRQGYLEALERLKAELGKEEKLAAAAQVLAEYEAVEDGEEAKPLPDNADHRLKALRKKWDEGLEKIITERSRKLAATAGIYFKALDEEKRKLTRAGKIKEALLFEEEEKRVRELPDIKAIAGLQGNEAPADEGNLALASRGATAEGAQEAGALIDGRTASSKDSGYAWAKIPSQMIVSLDAVHELEQIRLLLWDGDDRTYRYRLDVSEDGAQWETVHDVSRTGASGWQDIKFKPRAVRKIRILGLGNTTDRYFHVVEVEAYRTAR